ncbi:MAG: adenylosuccinate synthetase [Deltaproteobacteria bacterium]|nr:adenylosuccinate synthetase [Deltaproteobacteria bacterium]MBW2400131.1 adenylosuccinate synthetase [Deltaproteobacteria bacterium]
MAWSLRSPSRWPSFRRVSTSATYGRVRSGATPTQLPRVVRAIGRIAPPGPRLEPDSERIEVAEPVYETLLGWTEDARGCRNFEDLPRNARAYVERIEALVGVPVEILSLGPERDETISRTEPFRPRSRALRGRSRSRRLRPTTRFDTARNHARQRRRGRWPRCRAPQRTRSMASSAAADAGPGPQGSRTSGRCFGELSSPSSNSMSCRLAIAAFLLGGGEPAPGGTRRVSGLRWGSSRPPAFLRRFTRGAGEPGG